MTPCACKFKQDIADAAYRKRRGRPQLPGLGKVIADILFSLLLQGLFLIQVEVVNMNATNHSIFFIKRDLHFCDTSFSPSLNLVIIIINFLF